MYIAIGSDHRGLELKQDIIKLLDDTNHTCEDMGCYTVESVDYPDIASRVTEAINTGKAERGNLICGTGIGMSIAANKVKGIRAALCRDVFYATRARQHNDANVLCLGAENEQKLAADIVNAFLTTDFEGGRHQERLDKVSAMES